MRHVVAATELFKERNNDSKANNAHCPAQVACPRRRANGGSAALALASVALRRSHACLTVGRRARLCGGLSSNRCALSRPRVGLVEQLKMPRRGKHPAPRKAALTLRLLTTLRSARGARSCHLRIRRTFAHALCSIPTPDEHRRPPRCRRSLARSRDIIRQRRRQSRSKVRGFAFSRQNEKPWTALTTGPSQRARICAAHQTGSTNVNGFPLS